MRAGPQLLRITLAKGRRLDYVHAEWLASGPSELLLTFLYVSQGAGAKLSYGVLGTQSLTSFLKSSLSCSQYRQLLRAVCPACVTCGAAGVPSSDLCLVPEEIFAAAEGNPRFALAPLSKRTLVGHGSPLSLLAWLGSTENVRMVLEEDERQALAVGDWARCQSLFSLEGFSNEPSGSSAALTSFCE